MRFLPLALLATLSFPAFSEDDDESRVNMPISHPEVALEEGWKFGTDFGIVLDWDYNRRQPGVDEGSFFRIGGNVKLTASMLSGDHEWRNKLTFAEIFNKTPEIDALIKSNDRLGFESLWLWGFGGSWGTVVQLNVDTSVFPGDDFHEEPVNYRILNLDGTLASTSTATSLRLTSAFEPTYLRESIGFFVRPLNSPFFSWELKLTGYALQGLASGQKKIVDETGGIPNTITVAPLADFFHIGPSIGNFFFGEIIPKMFFYQINADVGYSAYESSAITVGSDFSKHILFTGIGSLTFKPSEWFALTWNVRGLYMPEVTDQFEIDSKLFFSFPFST